MTMSRSRCLLHKSKLTEFTTWLKNIGWVQEETKGVYEVLRMRHTTQGVLLIYDRSTATEHYTTFGVGTRLVHTWLHKKNDRS